MADSSKTAVELVVSADPYGAAAERAADLLPVIARDASRVRLAVTGGSASAAVREAFDRLDKRGFDFARLLLTWIDERCVPVASPESNRGALGKLPPAGVVLPLFEDGESPEDAVARADLGLVRRFGKAIDVALLGLGPDGHVASLFPGRARLLGRVAHVADSPKPPASRITLTRLMLATAQHTLVAARGAEKSEAIARLVAGDPTLAATGLRGLVVFTDPEGAAASKGRA